MLSPYRIPPNNTNERRQERSNNDSHREQAFKRPHLTSKEPTNENVKSLKSRNKNSSKGGSAQKNIEINGEYLNEILLNNNP